MSSPSRNDNLSVLRALSARLRHGPAVAAVRAGLVVLEDGVRARCPVGATHELVDSIHLSGPVVDDQGVHGAVVVGSDHALPEEYGTSTRAAHPFVRPTLDVDGPRAIQTMSNELKRAQL